MAKNRSATSPTKNGETIAAIAVVLYARPLCCPENWSVFSRYVPMVTYQAPQTKYWRNIITESFKRVGRWHRSIGLRVTRSLFRVTVPRPDCGRAARRHDGGTPRTVGGKRSTAEGQRPKPTVNGQRMRFYDPFLSSLLILMFRNATSCRDPAGRCSPSSRGRSAASHWNLLFATCGPSSRRSTARTPRPSRRSASARHAGL